MKYFTYTEFDSPDEVGSGKKMHPDILEMLDEVRDKFDKPMYITSGYRTEKHNDKYLIEPFKAYFLSCPSRTSTVARISASALCASSSSFSQ